MYLSKAVGLVIYELVYVKLHETSVKWLYVTVKLYLFCPKVRDSHICMIFHLF